MASIRKRGKGWQITVSNGYDSAKNKLTETKTVNKPLEMTDKQWAKELEKLALEFEREVQTGNYLDKGKITFAEFIDRWIQDYAEKQLQPKTLFRYKEMLDTRIIVALGHIKLEKLQPTHLLKFYNNLAEDGIRLDSTYIIRPEYKEKYKAKDLSELSGVPIKTIQSMMKENAVSKSTAIRISKAIEISLDKVFTSKNKSQNLSDQTILHHHRLISSILTAAVQWQFILNNPASRVKPPKVERKQAKYYDEAETKKLLDSLEIAPLKYKTAMYLVIYGGMRLGELDAIKWENVDFTDNLIRIERAAGYIPGTGSYTKETKNESSDRTIAMPQSVMNLLKQYKAWQNEERLKMGDLWNDTGYVFTQINGERIFHTTISGWFAKFRKRNNLPELTFHETRHTNAALLIGQGVNIQTVSKRLGHARTSTTTDIYGHALQRPDRDAVERLENLFNKDKDESTKQA